MPQDDAFFDSHTLEMDLQLQQRVHDEQLEEEYLDSIGAFRAAECACGVCFAGHSFLEELQQQRLQH